MQDCLQVVSLPRILAVKQLQELDGGEGTQTDRQEVRIREKGRWKQRDTEEAAGREKQLPWQNEEAGDVWPACRLKHSPVGQTSGLCTFWQCWAGIPDSPRTGWRTRIPTGGRRRRRRGRAGMEGGWEREREKMLKRFRISARSSIKLVWSAECWTGSHKRPAGRQQADSKIQEKSADWHVTVRNKIP